MKLRSRKSTIVVLSLVSLAAGSVIYLSALLQRTDTQVTNPIDWMIVESLYGKTLQSISELGELSSITAFDGEKQRLEKVLHEDPFILSARLTDARLLDLTGEREAPFLAQFSRYGCSSEGRDMNIERLMFCTVVDDENQRIRTLQYRRRSMGESRSDRYVINAHFDIEKMREQHATILSGALDYAESNRNTYDQKIPGEWSISSKYHLTAVERVDLQGNLQVSATEAPGIYEFLANIQATATLREGKSEFAVDECKGRDQPCSWTSSTSGNIKIVGNRVLLVYDDYFWRSDRLDLEAGMMSGENDWGSPSVYLRITAE